jgi:hypothetical protein
MRGSSSRLHSSGLQSITQDGSQHSRHIRRQQHELPTRCRRNDFNQPQQA